MSAITAKAKERFWTKVDIKGPNDCWNWLAGKHGHGYGMFYTGRNIRKGSSEFAHRVAYEMSNGPFDYSLCVMHSCDNMACVNPAHLTLGTHQDNMKDREAKGRNKVKTKLTLKQVIQIINAPKYIQNKWLAKTYNIDSSQISRVRNRKVSYWEKMLANKET